MSRPNPTRPYSVPGFRVALVREPGVKLAERPSLKTPAEAARVLSEYIGETDREVFVVALLTIRHRLIGAHTVSVGCLASSLVHPAMVMKPAIWLPLHAWSWLTTTQADVLSRAPRTWRSRAGSWPPASSSESKSSTTWCSARRAGT